MSSGAVSSGHVGAVGAAGGRPPPGRAPPRPGLQPRGGREGEGAAGAVGPPPHGPSRPCGDRAR